MTVGLRVIVVWWLAIALAVLAPFALRRAAWPSLRKGDLASIALGAVILDERLPVLTLSGAALALVGVACVLLNARRMVLCDR